MLNRRNFLSLGTGLAALMAQDTLLGSVPIGLKLKEETPWVNGKINGMQIGYREDGSKAMETLFENGKEISRKEF
jgi:antitoxin component YwqK of YwqJK toxin-antitoxin module